MLHMQMDKHGPDQAALCPIWIMVISSILLDNEDWSRHGQALDLHDDYLSETVKDGKENAAPATNTKPDNNWPQVEIRVADKRPGLCKPTLAAKRLFTSGIRRYQLLPTSNRLTRRIFQIGSPSM